MEPTQAGLALVTRTREALAMLGDMAFANVATLNSSTGLIVSTTPAFARFWLIPRIAKLHAEFPGLISGIEADSAFFESHTRKVDVAIRYGSGDWSDMLYERVGRSDRIMAVACPEIANEVRAGRDLTRLPLIETPYHSWRGWLAATGLSSTINSKLMLRASDSNTALDLCMAGFGVALIRNRLAAAELQAGRLACVHPKTVAEVYEYYVVWSGKSRLRKNIQILSNWLSREMDEKISGWDA